MIWMMFPETVSPDLVIELETRVPMKDGSTSGGAPLLPGPVVHVPPQLGGVLLKVFAKPLKLSGAGPPLNELSVDQFAPQNVTAVPLAASLSPIAKAPRDGKAKIVVLLLSEDGR